MSLSISDLFGNSAQTAQTGMTDSLKAGAQSAIGYLEQQTINLISADKAQHEASAQAATKDLLSQPSNPNSFGSYLSGLMQSPALQTYGPYVIGGVAVVAVIAVLLARK